VALSVICDYNCSLISEVCTAAFDLVANKTQLIDPVHGMVFIMGRRQPAHGGLTVAVQDADTHEKHHVLSLASVGRSCGASS